MSKLRKLTAALLALTMVLVLLPTSALAAEPQAKTDAALSTQTIVANGAEVVLDAYNIDGYNYFKLRDVAALMNGTSSQFSVAYDETGVISVVTGGSYTALADDLKAGRDQAATCVASPQIIQVNGVALDLNAYNIGGYNYFKLRDLGVAFGFKVSYNEESSTVVIEAGGYSLVFDESAYNKYSVEMSDGSVLEYRAYEKIVYESDPTVPEKNILTIYVPEAYYVGESIGKYNAENAPIFFKNGVGGYKEASISTLYSTKDGVNTINVYGQMLQHGLVVVSAACRGNDTLDETGSNELGLAPAGLVDLKAAIRYIRYNDKLIPGDSERIISDGASAGGAMSALVGTTGNSELYTDYLDEVGAADERDDVFAAFCYVPIIDLENLNMAYEWFYQETGMTSYAGKSTWTKNPDGSPVQMTDFEIALSGVLAAKYPEYINSKNLVKPGTNEPLTLNADGTGSYREYVAQLLIESAQSALDKDGELKATSYPAVVDTFTVKDGVVTDVDLPSYLTAINRLTGVGAMDNGFIPRYTWNDGVKTFVGMVQTNEALVYAINGVDTMVHFDPNLKPALEEAIEIAGQEAWNVLFEDRGEVLSVEDFAVTEGLDANDPNSIVYMMNPLNFIGDEGSDTAPNFYVCAGACDNDVSMITATLLGTSLYTAGECDELVIKYEWDRKHGGDYDVQAMFDWIDQICDPIKFHAESGTEATLSYDGRSVAYTAYEGLVYCTAPVDTAYESLNVYIPETADETSPILVLNDSGGYNSSTASNVAQANETAQRALAAGYVVVSTGLRGQNTKVDNGDGTSSLLGRCPAAVVDLKAAVRYLKYNDAAMPGDADKIIMAGTSSGGGTTALVGVTANSAEYEPYLAAIGAADADDSLYACICYCPVFDLGSSDLSYAWQVQDLTATLSNAEAATRSYISGNLGLFHNARNGYTVNEDGSYTLNEEELALTAYFASEFPAYMNAVLEEIGLDLSINADGRTGTFVDHMKKVIEDEYDRYLKSGEMTDEEVRMFINGTGTADDHAVFSVDRSAWLSYNEETGNYEISSLWDFYDYVGLLKAAPAFDGKRESNVFGEIEYATGTSSDTKFDKWMAAYYGYEIPDEILAQEHLYSVFDFVNDAETVNTANWFIRYGTCDNGIHAYPALLAASLEAQGNNVDFRMAFERTHSGFYELDELFTWLESIVGQ